MELYINGKKCYNKQSNNKRDEIWLLIVLKGIKASVVYSFLKKDSSSTIVQDE